MELNGTELNGMDLNGMDLNGMDLNEMDLNGTEWNQNEWKWNQLEPNANRMEPNGTTAKSKEKSEINTLSGRITPTKKKCASDYSSKVSKNNFDFALSVPKIHNKMQADEMTTFPQLS